MDLLVWFTNESWISTGSSVSDIRQACERCLWGFFINGCVALFKDGLPPQPTTLLDEIGTMQADYIPEAFRILGQKLAVGETMLAGVLGKFGMWL